MIGDMQVAEESAGARAEPSRSSPWRRRAALVASFALGAVFALVVAELRHRSAPRLEPWHSLRTDESAALDPSGRVQDFEDYREWERGFFGAELARLSELVDGWPALSRFDPMSPTWAGAGDPNWNRSVVLEAAEPVGGVLLLHGLSDSPYSLRAIGERLRQEGWTVVAPRMPGHGLFPGALTQTGWRDWRRVVRLAAEDLRERIGADRPLVLVGYSNGAGLALDLTIGTLENHESELVPARIVLLSPALAVTPAARWGPLLTGLSRVPGLGSLAWQGILPEYDPYKYNSFPVRAAREIYELIVAVERGLQRLEMADRLGELPPILTLQSAVDSTVPPVESLQRLYRRIHNPESELVLFDANRRGSVEDFLSSKSRALLELVAPDSRFPFAATLVTNRSADSDEMVAITRLPNSVETRREALDLSWPAGIYSLSHVAIPFPPEDPVYGEGAVEGLGLGGLAIKGERGILKIPFDLLSRLRYNPFFSYLELRLLQFIEPLAGPKLDTEEANADLMARVEESTVADGQAVETVRRLPGS